MADTARSLDVVKRVVEMCDFIENPAIQETVRNKIVPVSMVSDINSVLKISVCVGLGIVGLWASLDAFAERTNLTKWCPTCRGEKNCVWARFEPYASGDEGEVLKELQDLRHLYAHNYAGEADSKYFSRSRHVLQSDKSRQLKSNALFSGNQPHLDLTHLRTYAFTVQGVLERIP